MVNTNLDSNGILWVSSSGAARETWQVGGYHNYNGVVATNVRIVGESDLWFDGNNQAGSIGLTLAGSTLEGHALVTNYTGGIFGQTTGTNIIGGSPGAIRVQSAESFGVAISGGATVMNVDVSGIHSATGNSFGLIGWGNNNNFWYDRVWDVSGHNETVGISTGGSASIAESTITGSASATGWMFGAWVGAGDVTIERTTISGFDSGIANVGKVILQDSSISGRLYDIVNQDTLHFRDDGGNTRDVTSTGTIGDTGVNHLTGTAAADHFYGNGGKDTMYGNGGADTFHFVNDGLRVVLPDFDSDDSLDLGAFDPLGAVSFNPLTHELQYNGQAIAYIPQANDIADVAYYF